MGGCILAQDIYDFFSKTLYNVLDVSIECRNPFLSVLNFFFYFFCTFLEGTGISSFLIAGWAIPLCGPPVISLLSSSWPIPLNRNPKRLSCSESLFLRT